MKKQFYFNHAIHLNGENDADSALKIELYKKYISTNMFKFLSNGKL